MSKTDTGAPLYVRRDVWQLSAQPWHPVIEWYARAIRILQSRDGAIFADPTSWRHLAEIHGSSTPPSARPRGVRWNQCEHGTWFFLPWHRIYLHHFEKIVRQVVVAAGGPADWALPFWDYSDPARPETRMLPPAFREATLPSGEPNPLRVEERGPHMNVDGELAETAVGTSAAFAESSFTETAGGGASGGFGGAVGAKAHLGRTPGALEITPHGDVHMGVGGSEEPGGWMSGFNTAGRDPIFWSTMQTSIACGTCGCAPVATIPPRHRGCASASSLAAVRRRPTSPLRTCSTPQHRRCGTDLRQSALSRPRSC